MWKLTITVPSGKLEKVMRALAMKEVTLKNEDMVYIEDTNATVTRIPKAKGRNKRVESDHALTMNTNKHAQRGSLMEKTVKEFEKVEATHGIGNVTRGVFTDHLLARKPRLSNDPRSSVAQVIKAELLLSLEPGGVDAATYGR